MQGRRQGIMLCQPWSESNFRRLTDYIYIQPKLNGARCRVDWINNQPMLLSSEGNAFWGLDHITEALTKHHHQGLPFDGELYVHGWSREQIHSAISRKANSSAQAAQIEFHIFDIQLQALQSKRFEALTYYFSTVPTDSPLKQVPTKVIPKLEWLEHALYYTNQSYEGLILRHPDAFYQVDKRPATCIKFKPTETDTYTILEVLEAIDIHGSPKATTGAFLVADREGNQFKVSAGKLTHQERDAIWLTRHLQINHLLQVKHEYLRTTNSIPVAAVAVKII